MNKHYISKIFALTLSTCVFTAMVTISIFAQDPKSEGAIALEEAEYINQLVSLKGQPYADFYRQYIEHFALLEDSPDIVFLGDSLTANGDWQSLSENLRIINMGIPQDTISGLETRLDQVAKLSPKALFLLIGINDLSTTWRPTVYEHYNQFLDKLVNALPNTKIYVQSILPVRDDIRTIMSNDVLVIVNQRIRQMADSYEVTYINVFDRLINQKQNQLYLEYQIDGLHLSEAGYAAWKQVLEPYVRNIA